MNIAFNKYLLHFEKQYAAYFESLQDFPVQLLEIIKYAALNGGKRIRPLLVYVVGHLFNIDIAKLDPIAIAIEMIHSYSLTHDDLPGMDNAAFRRGKPSCHKQYGEANAILTGDALLTLAFQVIAEHNDLTAESKIKIINYLAYACGGAGMIAGQFLDCDLNWQPHVVKDLQKLHQNKTGKLFAACCVLPIYLSTAKNQKWVKEFENIGLELGLIFQIQDDLLDATSTVEKLGKDTKRDMILNKKTFISLLDAAECKHIYNEKIKNLKEKLQQLPYENQQLLSLIQLIQERTF